MSSEPNSCCCVNGSIHQPTGNIKTRFNFLPAAAVILFLAGFSGHEVATWSIDASHSRIGFKVRHLGISNVHGEFGQYDATINMEDEDLQSLQATITIEVGSIDTRNDRRDNHLKSEDFFSAEAFPIVTFESTKVANLDETTFDLVGNLTIRDVTKEVVLNAEYLGSAKMGDSQRAGFQARTSINRLDYGLAWDRLTEAGGVVVGHDVEIILELELVKDDD